MCFSYFGGKMAKAHLYPPPKYQMILEPFCGSAAYSMLHGRDRDVWINDKYDAVVRIWRWVQKATLKDLMSLPDLRKGDKVSAQKQLSDDEKTLLRFNVSRGTTCGRDMVTDRGECCIKAMKARIRPLIGNISHWKITRLDYGSVTVEYPATYFVDAPYQFRKSDYVITTGRGFYDRLAKYVTDLSGERIVCEGKGANWLPFEPLYRHRTTFVNQTEMLAYLSDSILFE